MGQGDASLKLLTGHPYSYISYTCDASLKMVKCKSVNLHMR